MTAIAGYASRRGGDAARDACAAVLSRLEAYGPDACGIRQVGDTCFGIRLRRLLPEDDADRQPLLGESGRTLLVFDGRIDNRSEVLRDLGRLDRKSAAQSDSALVLWAWERWELGFFDRLLGDFAMAVWEEDDHRLTLARSALSTRALFYHAGAAFTAFASLPQALLAIGSIPRRIDTDEAVAIAAAASTNGAATVFAGIQRVRHGCAVRFVDGREHHHKLWTLGPGGRATGSARFFGQALRTELERAVEAQLRRRAGSIACQVSSGRDSSAVFTVAVEHAGRLGGDILAVTGAPHAGFERRSDSRLCDESAVAARTVARHRRARHLVCRPEPGQYSAKLDELHHFHHGPLLNPASLPWWYLINEECSRRGVSVLLTAALGNFSLSMGGSRFLADVRRIAGFREWLRRARQFAGESPGSWPRLLYRSLGGMAPQFAINAARAVTGRTRSSQFGMPFLREPYRSRGETHLREQFGRPRPPSNNYEAWRDMLEWSDTADRVSLGRWGIDVRDPAGDRRLVELCYSFPPGVLASDDSRRLVYEAAFGERIAPEVVRCARRGLQSADWAEQYSPTDIRQAFARYRSPAVRELIDFEAVDLHLRRWPAATPQSADAVHLYRNRLLGTLALASFLNVHFPD